MERRHIERDMASRGINEDPKLYGKGIFLMAAHRAYLLMQK